MTADQLDPTADPKGYVSAACPLSECGAELYITWTASRPVFLVDTAADLRDASGAYSKDWEIGCGEGHILLTPTGSGGDSEVFGESNDDIPRDDLEQLRRLLRLKEADA
jgi:hypothetical protein